MHLGFWLDTLARKARIPYPIFFGLIGLGTYLLGIPVMIATDNLERFLVQLNWMFLTLIGVMSGISVVFVYRKFLSSLNKIKPLVSSEEEFERLKSRVIHHLSHWVQWVPVIFWITINLLTFITPQMRFWGFYGSYNQLLLVAVYYQIAGLPSNIFGGVIMYVIPFGLTLGYREICTKTAVNQKQMLSDWMSPFSGFRNLITLALLLIGVYSILALLTYTAAPSIFPYSSILLVVIPTLVFPHYYFHGLFSKERAIQLSSIRQKLMSIPSDRESDLSRRILLLLEEGRIERKKTWLIDIVTITEILIVALMHVLLVELLTMFVHI